MCPKEGLLRELNPGPLAPKARIIPLDQAAIDFNFFFDRSDAFVGSFGLIKVDQG